jgi:hypothetical protein
MRAYLSILAFICIATGGTKGDVCIQQQSHTDEYYDNGQIFPAEDRLSEYWFGDQIMSNISGTRKIIIDLKNNAFYFINLVDSSYVESDLPFDWNKVVSQEIASVLHQYRTFGSVEGTVEKGVKGEWPCTAYRVRSWKEHQGERFDEEETTIWMTTALPLDWNSFYQIQISLHRLQNRDDAFLLELEGIKGFHIASETERMEKGFTVQSSVRVIEVSKKEPASDTYAVPAGFQRKETLSWQDLR